MADCTQGHANPEGQRFCGDCGEPLPTGLSEAPPTNEAFDRVPVPGGVVTADEPGVRACPGWLIPAVVGGALIAIVLIAVFVLGGGGGDEGQRVSGTFTLFDQDTADLDCIGTGGYNDIGPGTEVRVSDEGGTVLATGALGSGKDLEGLGCIYRFSLKTVPDANFYEFEVAHRGGITYSRAKLENQEWRVDLSLGDIGNDL
ncbi:MAG: zinc ribbon domain-containing protein [Acidimicrobiia bacterium]